LGVTKAGSLYFGARSSERDISVTTVDLATGKQLTPAIRPIQQYVGTNLMPDWSPDGKYLAYVSQRGFNPTANTGRIIGIRTLSTGEERELHPKLVYIDQISWSPDASAFLTGGTDLKGRSGVFRIDAQTGDVTLVVESTINVYPKWSPDGRRLYYRRPIDGSAAATDANQPWSIVVRDLSTRSERAVATGAIRIFSVSPDGQTIAAVIARPGRAAASTVVLIRVDTGETRDLLRPGPSEVIPVFTGLPWTPDGRAVLVRKRTPNEIWLVPITGAAPRRLDVDVSQWNFGPFGVISLHPDGRQLASTAGSLNSEVMTLQNVLPAPNGKIDR
jgi:Tol biopolymer transport system component